MDLKKLEKHIICTARTKKKKLSEDMPAVTIGMELWEIKKDKFLSLEVGGKIFEPLPNNIHTIYELNRLNSSIVEDLNRTRGYIAFEQWGKYWYSVRDVFGTTMKSVDFIKGITLIRKPCKEFNAMQKRVFQATGLKLEPLDLFRVKVVGKRGKNYQERGEREYYAHDPYTCRRISEWFKTNVKRNYHAEASIEAFINDEDASYATEYETESYGTKYQCLHLKAIDKNGRIVTTSNF